MTTAVFTEFVLVGPRIGADDGANTYRVSRIVWVWFVFILVAGIQFVMLISFQRKISAFKRFSMDYYFERFGLHQVVLRPEDKSRMDWGVDDLTEGNLWEGQLADTVLPSVRSSTPQQ